MLGSDALVRMLDQVGVDIIFGLCGDTSLPFYDSLSNLKPNLKHIVTRDERSSSYMADAYSRISGQIGVCEGPSGGGVTYIIPGVAEANQSSAPLMVLTTDIDVRNRGRGTLTELDQDALFRPITSWTKTPSHAEELPWTVREGFRRATTGKLGAVHIGIPLNVQKAKISESDVYIDPRFSKYPAYRQAPELSCIKSISKLLLESKRPLIIAGAGVIRSEAWEELQDLVELLGCPVATSISGKGAISETHSYALGVIGSNGGLAYRHEYLKSADLFFFIGCQAGSVTTNKWTLPSWESNNIIQLDVDGSCIGRNYNVIQGAVADAKLGLSAIIEEILDMLGARPVAKISPDILSRNRKIWLDQMPEFESDEIPIMPERFVKELSHILPLDAIILADAGTPTPYLSAYLRLPKSGRWFVSPRAHGALGYSLPATIGAYFARPQSKIIGIMGDASFAMSAGELETIARLNLPITLIVLTNSCYGWVKAGQKAMGSKYYAVDFSMVDHAKVAKAYGISATRVEDPQELSRVLIEAMNAQKPMLVDIIVKPLHETRAPVLKWIA
jgi:acetolactate synthase-1/2/3 large subunit